MRELQRSHRLQIAGMSAGGSEDTAGTGDVAAEEESQSYAGSSAAAVDLPRKRKGDVDPRETLDFQMDDELSRSEGEDQQVKMKCFREPHRQIEKRRRDKMNNLIDELSAMIPACQPMARKLDKLTVLRKAVQHLKTLKVGMSSAFTDTTYKPSILPHDDLRRLLLRAAEGFLLVVTCDRAKILFVSESVTKVLNFSPLELTGQSLFDFIHPKDINTVKEQLSSSESSPRQCFMDGAGPSVTMSVPVTPELPVKASHLSTGARRSFFCRMKHSRVAGKQDENQSLPNVSKRKDSSRYCTLHCTGYMRSWPSSQLDTEGDDDEVSSLTCLVTVCRVHTAVSHQTSTDIRVRPTEFTTRCSIDGKFTFVDQQATAIIGYLPQEVLGTSCYEYFHQNDLMHLAETHRQVLQSKEKIETQCYKFKTKYGYYVSLQSRWYSFTNPWTKEIEFIVSLNRLVSTPGDSKDEEEAGSSAAAQGDSKQMPIISSGGGTMIYAGSIGTQIANELIDSYRVNSSPSSGASSPFGSGHDKGPVVSPQTSRSVSSKEEAAGSSQSLSESSSATGGAAGTSSDTTGETLQLDMDNVVPGLSSFSSDEAAMAVLMSLLETDVTMGQAGGSLEDLQWSHTDF